MKFRRHTSFFAAFIAAIFVLLSPLSAQAASFYYRFAPPLPTATCLIDHGEPAAKTNAITLEYNLPAGASLIDYIVDNGVATFLGAFPAPSGTGTRVYGGDFFSETSFPFTVSEGLDTLIGGQLVYTSLLTVHCASDGAAGVVTITNTAAGNGGGSAIADGRINPENYAPVALYCDGSVLTAYAIDSAGQGTKAWGFDLKNASSDTPLIDQFDITLSKTTDGRYSVLASQHDGKQYLFVFDGCPAPGTTEVYISDPTTGQFVRAE